MNSVLPLILAVVLLCVTVPAQDVAADSLPTLKKMKNRKIPEGERDYIRFCSFCHGRTGSGDGLNAFNLAIRPRNFTDTSAFRKIEPVYLQQFIRKGGAAGGLSGDMPPWGTTLDSARISDLVRYVLYLRAH